jgi:DNA-binding GntR family transcriptional regulator
MPRIIGALARLLLRIEPTAANLPMHALELPTDARPAAAPARAQAMYERVVAAIVEQRLRPGTKLPEEKLARLFTVSRTQVRRVLQRLAHEGMVELQLNRGAFVAAPSRAYTQEVFAARRLIEPWLVERLCTGARGRALAPLRRVLDEERRARKAGDRHAIVRASGEFHRVLAQLAGNPPLAKAMHELTAQTCLAILLYHAPTAVSCRDDEHAAIVAAMARGDARAAMRLMRVHLDHIERALAEPPAQAAVDPLVVLAEHEHECKH